ncbi:MAG: hypothetical protein IT437_04825 [Phycisphaerales bacterium]|nr:hypothetical protein [Phycisphaerales bacterium]
MKRELMMGLVLGLSGLACGQSATPPPKPAEPPVEKAPPRPAEPPDLDELLGLKPAKDANGTADPAAKELERELSLREAADGFEEAVGLMGRTAERLGGVGDTGVATQRMQESVIRKLDVLIKAAEQQAKKSRSSSSSKPQQNKDPSQQPNQQQSREQNEENRGDNRDERLPPGRRDGALGPEPSRGAAWGSLPARVREALLQGTQDTYSSVYQRLTESYFRKLAEEPR